MTITNLQQLFEHELSDLHSTETQIIAALPKMIKSASDEKLKAALEDHLNVTTVQLDRIETIAKDMNIKISGMTCDGMKGIITEGDKALAEISDVATKDAAIIAAAQRVEHYEMAAYGTAEEYARKLGLDDAADLLKETLNEEKEADASLSGLAKGGLFNEGLNEQAIDE